MRRILAILLIIGIISPFLAGNSFATSKSGTFVVTAYYSPLPGQDFYLTGDYESEKRLNGQGIRGASGKGVFSGMLAAPKNYSFGTKIYLEGLGVGVVEDRGGAIVNAGNRGYTSDRIDVWVGYGDDGLRRALYWGKRTVKGSIINSNEQVTLNYKTISAPLWATNGLKKIPNIFNNGIGKKSPGNLITGLKKFLIDISFYNGDTNGIYDNKLINLIYDFQIENALIKAGEYYGAGYWGSATRALFLKKYLNGEFDHNESNEVEIVKSVEEFDNYSYVFESSANSPEKVKRLQYILTQLGFYTGKQTGIYKDTIDAVYDYQFSVGIVTSVYSPGAGSYGPKTRASLKDTYNSYLKEKDDSEQEKIRIEEKKKQEELRKKELEEKYKHLEELSLKKAEEKMSFIGNPKFGEISHGVRELQITLKDLGFFNNKDTAIYGSITKQSIISYQIDRQIIESDQEAGAGVIGPMTKKALKNDLREQFLKEIVKKEELDSNELASIIGNKA